jgi:prevent-host-death family protein
MSVVASIPLPLEAVPDRLPDAVAHVERGDGRVVLTRDGKPVAAVVPIADLRTLEEDDAEDEYWSGVADEAVKQWEAEGRPAGIPMEDITHELGVELNAEP